MTTEGLMCASVLLSSRLFEKVSGSELLRPTTIVLIGRGARWRRRHDRVLISLDGSGAPHRFK